MSPRYDDDWVASLLDVEVRLGDTTPEEVLLAAGLGSAQTVVDYGCGPGFLTFPAAQIVGPGGTVYAVDVEQKMVDLIGTKAAEMGIENVSPVLADGRSAPLPGETADFLICAQVLHYPEETAGRVEMARDIGRLLRPDGRALVIEWTPQPDEESGSRMKPEDVEALLGRADLQADGPQPLGPRQYLMVATRKTPSAG